jgi:hypothetical protein
MDYVNDPTFEKSDDKIIETLTIEEIRLLVKYLTGTISLSQFPKSHYGILKNRGIDCSISELYEDDLNLKIDNINDRLSKLETIITEYMMKDFCASIHCKNKIHKGKWCKNHVCADSFCEMNVESTELYCEFHQI